MALGVVAEGAVAAGLEPAGLEPAGLDPAGLEPAGAEPVPGVEDSTTGSGCAVSRNDLAATCGCIPPATTLRIEVRLRLVTRSVICPTRGFTGDITSAALYAGRSVGAVTGEMTAAAIVEEFAAALGQR